MTIALRQSTASQEIALGYFLDSTDGNTEETALSIANTDIKLHKFGATTLANKNSGGATHISNGIYYSVLDATDTDTVGPLVIFCHVAGALTVRLECHVFEEAVFDALYAASAPGYGTAQTGDSFARIGATGSGLTSLASAAALATVDSIVDDILLDTAEIGTAGAGLTNINLPDQAMNITGNITGNLSGSVGSVTAGVTVSGTITTLDALNTAQIVEHDATQTAISALNDVSVTEILTTQITQSYAADGAAPTISQALLLIQQMLGDRLIVGTTMTVYRLDGSTVAATFTLNDATLPTGITRAS